MTRRLFGTLCGFVFLVNLGRVAFAPLVEPLQVAFGVGPAAVGFVTTLVWIGTAAPRIPVGYLLTRVPRHRVVLATGLLLSGAAAFTASASSVLALQVGAFVIGLASGAYFVAAIPLVGELYPDSMGRAVGVHGTAAQLAAVLAPGLVVAVLVRASWREVFWLLAAAALTVTLALSVVIRNRDGIPGPPSSNRDFRAAFAHWRIILAGFAIVGSVGFVWQGLFNFYISYVTATKGLDPGTASTLLTVMFATGVPAFWFGGRLADRFPHTPYLLAIHLSFTVCLLALTAASSTVTLVAVTAVLGFVVHSLFPAIDTYMLENLPVESRASAYAVFSGVALLFEANGSGAVGLLSSRFGFDAVFLAFAAALGAVFLGLVAFAAVGRFPGAEESDVAGSDEAGRGYQAPSDE